MKKAIIDQMMLGVFLFFVLIVLGATVADDIKAKNEASKLRTTIQNAALASAKYYTFEENDTTQAQSNANLIVSKTKLGNSVKNNLVYTWDLVNEPNTVTVNLNNHKVDYFWYRFIGLDNVNVNLEAKAEISSTNTSDIPACICGQTAGVALVGRTLCIVGTHSEEQVQVASDSSDWKVKSVFEDGDWEEEKWFQQSAVDNVFVITFNGDDQIQLNDVNVPTIVDGGCGDDQIQGSTGPDTIYGNEGDDQIEGKEGNDIIYGGNGDDQVQGGNHNDTIYTDGNDSIDGGGGSNTIDIGIGYSDDCVGTVVFECSEESVILKY